MALPGETVHLGADKPEGEELQLLSTPAGYYLGYLEDGQPYSRETIYFEREEDAQTVLDRYNELNDRHREDMELLTNRYWRY